MCTRRDERHVPLGSEGLPPSEGSALPPSARGSGAGRAPGARLPGRSGRACRRSPPSTALPAPRAPLAPRTRRPPSRPRHWPPRHATGAGRGGALRKGEQGGRGERGSRDGTPARAAP